MARVVFPCDQDCWWLVKDHLINLKQECIQVSQAHKADIASVQQPFSI